MPTVLEWNPTVSREDLRQAIAAAAQMGAPIVLPGDCGYAVALPLGSSRLPELLRQLPELPAWWVTEAEQLRQRGLAVPSTLERLFRRGWPSPVVALLPVAAIGGGTQNWPELAVDSQRRLRLRHPEHPVASEVSEAIDSSAWLIADSFLPTVESVLDCLDEVDAFAISAGPLSIQQDPPSQVLLHPDGWDLLSEGAVRAEELAPLLARVILFVCTGNTCRSPLAEGLARQLTAERLGCRVEELPQRGWWITSAGLCTAGGWPASAEAVQVAAEVGVDLREHRSRPLYPWLLAIADEVITMTQEHRQMLLARYPGVGPPPRLLCEQADVPDPIGAGLDTYRACAALLRQQVERCLAEWLQL